MQEGDNTKQLSQINCFLSFFYLNSGSEIQETNLVTAESIELKNPFHLTPKSQITMILNEQNQTRECKWYLKRIWMGFQYSLLQKLNCWSDKHQIFSKNLNNNDQNLAEFFYPTRNCVKWECLEAHQHSWQKIRYLLLS